MSYLKVGPGRPSVTDDACVIAYLLNPGLFRNDWRREAVEIHDEMQMGRTSVVQDEEVDIQVATDDVEGLFAPQYEDLASPPGASQA